MLSCTKAVSFYAQFAKTRQRVSLNRIGSGLFSFWNSTTSSELDIMCSRKRDFGVLQHQLPNFSSHRARSFWNSTWTDGKRLVGRDAIGNTYWEIDNPGCTPNPRREIDYAEKQLVRLVNCSVRIVQYLSYFRLKGDILFGTI